MQIVNFMLFCGCSFVFCRSFVDYLIESKGDNLFSILGFSVRKYINYAKRIYQTLDLQLKKNEYLGIKYSVADIATWPWVARFERQRIDLEKYPNVLRWYKLIAERPAVIKGYNVIGKFEKIPLA